MKKTNILLSIIFVLTFMLTSCTDNQRARKWGGTETIQLEPNEKFINITWKGDDLWVIVEDTTTHIYYAKEKSSFGVMEGKIAIKR